MEVHEFWLGGVHENKRIYRVTLGELIDERDRKALNPRLVERCESNKSGSIGFMDVAIRNHFVPKEGFEDGDCFNYEHVEALTIMGIGIEPGYEGKGYAGLLEKKAQEIAIEWGKGAIVFETIIDSKMRGFGTRRGYQLFADGDMAVKRLNPKYQFLRPPP